MDLGWQRQLPQHCGNDHKQSARIETRRHGAFDRVEHVETVDYRYDAVDNRTKLTDADGKSSGLGRLTLNGMYQGAKSHGVPLGPLLMRDAILPALSGQSEMELEARLIHDSRRGATGFWDRWTDRHERTIYGSRSGKQTLTSQGMVRRWRLQQQSQAENVQEAADGQLIMGPVEVMP